MPPRSLYFSVSSLCRLCDAFYQLAFSQTGLSRNFRQGGKKWRIPIGCQPFSQVEEISVHIIATGVTTDEKGFMICESVDAHTILSFANVITQY